MTFGRVRVYNSYSLLAHKEQARKLFPHTLSMSKRLDESRIFSFTYKVYLVKSVQGFPILLEVLQKQC